MRWGQSTLPLVVDKLLTPEMEENLKLALRKFLIDYEIKSESSHLDYEWMLERLLEKLKNFRPPEPQQETTTAMSSTMETLPASIQITESILATKCSWGPILCSINRISFQRKDQLDKRLGEVLQDDMESTAAVNSRHPKIVPQWIQSIKAKVGRSSSKNHPSAESSFHQSRPHHLPKLFRRFLI